MLDLVFPASLPGPEWDSMQWAPTTDPVLRSSMDIGQRRRRRSSAVTEQFSCTLYVTAAELETLLDFHDIDCLAVRSFEWFDFRRPNDPDRRAIYSFLARPTQGTWADIFRVDLRLLLEQTFSGTRLFDVTSDTTGLTS